MRATSNFARRGAAVALAGALAFGAAGCDENDGTDVDTNLDEGSIVDDLGSGVDGASDAVSTADDAT